MSTFNELIDFTRSTTGTYLDSVVYGPELVTNGTFNTDSDWAKGTGWAISGGTASKTAGTGSSLVSTTLNGTIGKSYLLTFDLTLSAGVINSTLGAAVTPVYNSSGSYAKILKPTTTGAFQFYGSAAFAGSIDNVSVKEIIGGQVSAGTPLLRTAAINEPRLEYDASGNPLGLLIEEARTNVVTQSNFSSTWNMQNASITKNLGTSPDKSNNAVKLNVNTTSAYHGIYNNVAGGTYAVSVFAKAGEYSGIQLTGTNATQDHACFNLVDGTAYHTGSNVLNANIQDVGDGWYRCSAVIPLTNGLVYIAVTDGVSTSWLPSFVGSSNTDGIYIYGAQVESGSFPTSYIPTSGSTVTRTKDIARLPVERFAYSQAQGSIVFYADVFSQGQDATPRLYEFSDGSNNNAIRLYNPPAVDRLTADVRSGGVSVFADNMDSPDFNEPFKIFQTYKVNDFSVGFNGKLEQNDISGAVPIGIVRINLFSKHSGSNVNNGHIKQIQYFPKRLSNEELELLTQPSASPTMNLTFDGQATSTLVEGLHD